MDFYSTVLFADLNNLCLIFILIFYFFLLFTKSSLSFNFKISNLFYSEVKYKPIFNIDKKYATYFQIKKIKKSFSHIST